MYNFDKSVAPLSAVLVHIYLAGYFICVLLARYTYKGYGSMPNAFLENTYRRVINLHTFFQYISTAQKRVTDKMFFVAERTHEY